MRVGGEVFAAVPTDEGKVGLPTVERSADVGCRSAARVEGATWVSASMESSLEGDEERASFRREIPRCGTSGGGYASVAVVAATGAALGRTIRLECDELEDSTVRNVDATRR